MAKPKFLLFFVSILLLLLLLSASLVSAHGGAHDDDDDDDSNSDSDSPPPNLRAKSLILVKVYCLILVFVGTFIGGVSPYFFKWNEGFLALGTQFAGGVFLGTAMMHFLSDSNETFESLTEKDYPFAFMLACSGYLVTMLVDCIISYVIAGVRRGGGVHEGAANDRNGSFNQGPTSNNDVDSQAKIEDGGHVEHDQTVKALLNDASTLGDTLLLIFALCFHSVFEGIAIGVAENKAEAWRAMWTISLHKVFAAIAMGIALLRMIPNRPLLSCAAYSFAFAISTPIGVAIGIVINATTQGRVADWIYAISMGIACGIFIYVSINHLFAKGYKPQKLVLADTPINRWMAVVLGVGVIAVVMIWD